MDYLNDFFNSTPTQPFILIAALIGVLGAFALQRYIFFRKACDIFKQTFVHTIHEINSTGYEVIAIERDFAAHKSAAITFSCSLKGSNLTSFNDTLSKYEDWYKAVCNREAGSRMYPDMDKEYQKYKDEKGIDHINSLLNFTKTT